MVKEAVDIVPQLPKEEIGELVARWGLGAVVEVQKLYGGFSGSNYRVVDDKGARAVLKVCHSYEHSEVCEQAAVMGHLGERAFPGACAPLPMLPANVPEGGLPFVTSTPSKGEPAMLLTFCEGKAADAVIEAGVDAHVALHDIGVNLARLHQLLEARSAAQVEPAAHLRDYTKSGACNLGDHAAKKWTPLFRENEHTSQHPYVAFYERYLNKLDALIGLQGIPSGIIHGDPFLDNILIDEATGAFQAFVDFEDACVGPLLFDVACCAAAACYEMPQNKLDTAQLGAFLRGYTSVRQFTAAERTAFVGFMQVTLLCNCTWRFKNFNIDHREVVQCRDAHKELQDRIVDLEDASLVADIDAQMALACQ